LLDKCFAHTAHARSSFDGCYALWWENDPVSVPKRSPRHSVRVNVCKTQQQLCMIRTRLNAVSKGYIFRIESNWDQSKTAYQGPNWNFSIHLTKAQANVYRLGTIPKPLSLGKRIVRDYREWVKSTNWRSANESNPCCLYDEGNV
jgi:hypothetical protein